MRQVKLGDLQFTDKFREYLDIILTTKRVSYGPISSQLEEEVAKLHGAKYGVLSNSGTSSLQVALHALKIQNNWPDGSEVLVPATTFPATINVILQNNLKPVFVDVHPRYYDMNLNFSNGHRYLTTKTVAIMPVNLFGQSCDLNTIFTIADTEDLKVIIDSCEAIGIGHDNRSLMTYADIICFSFYNAHVVQGGVGGASITSNQELATLMRSLVNHGRRPTYISIDDEVVHLTDRFTFDHVGYSYRITEFESALALANLQDINTNIARRREIAMLYNIELDDIGFLQLPTTRLSSEHCWMMYPLVITDPKVDKLHLCKYLEENGIETRDMLPLINQPVALNHYGLRERYPVSEDLIKNGFYISSSNHLMDDDIRYVTKVLWDYKY